MLQLVAVTGLLISLTTLIGDAPSQSGRRGGRSTAPSPSLSEVEIAEAIAAGLASKGQIDLVSVGSTRPTYSVYFVGPFMRVSRRAADAATKYLPFTRAAVSADDLKPIVRIEAQTSNQYGMAVEGALSGNKYAAVAPPIRHLVLRAPDGAVIQPVNISHNDDVKQLESRISAEIALNQMPSGAFEVVLVTTDGETVIPVDVATRQRIR
jgi:hypothetical protein